MGLFSGISHAFHHITHPVSHLFSGASHLVFGSSPKIKYPDPQKLVMPRDWRLQNAYNSIDLIPDDWAKWNYLDAARDYAYSLSPLINQVRQDFYSPTPVIDTPFGTLPAYGLKNASLRTDAAGSGLLSSLLRDKFITPAELNYRLNYELPLNTFLKEDLARYGVQSTPYAVGGSSGLLGGILGAAAKPIGSWLGGVLTGNPQKKKPGLIQEAFNWLGGLL